VARRFHEHQRRRVVCLDGLWDFAFLGDVAEPADPGAIRFDDVMAVPGCFDATPRYAGRRGLAAYRTCFAWNHDGPARLELDGAHHACTAFLDGARIGAHRGGFTRFYLDLGPRPAGAPACREAELVVLVDNRFDRERSPLHLDYFDWYQYGGLARGARVHFVARSFIERVEATTVDLGGPTLGLGISYRTLEPGARVPLEVRVAGHEVWSEQVSLTQARGSIDLRLQVPFAPLWSPERPNLVFLDVRLGDDDFCTRVGLRTVGSKDGRLAINDEPVALLGVNRHEAHPDFGHAVPPQIELGDLQLLRELGANFLRGSHYPQDDGLLDLCDELGILVWCEGIGWQQTREQLTDPVFMDAQRDHLDEMLDASFNHPSIVLWGVLNEGDSSEAECRPAFASLLSHVKARDPHRPVTFATCRPRRDLCLDLVDVVSVNAYPGWYQGTLDEIPTELRDLVAHLKAVAPGKPIIVSEIGAGAIYGFHERNGRHWTEEYQAALLDRVLHTLVGEELAGVCIWQFCDTKTTEATRTVMGRPRGYNNKGLLDEYRRPKLAFDVVKRWFSTIREDE
jgi:beta-glucuronidase